MKRPAKFRHAFLGLAILACFGIWYFLVRVPYTRNEPKESNLIGVYRPDFKRHFSVFKSNNLPPANSEIRVDAGGKIKLVNLLPWLLQDATNSFEVTSISTNGIWRLEKSDDRWFISSDFAQKDGNISISLSLIGEKPPYNIRFLSWEIFGAPIYFVQGTN